MKTLFTKISAVASAKVVPVVLTMSMALVLLPVTAQKASADTGYGSNGKLLAPIEPPVAGSMPIFEGDIYNHLAKRPEVRKIPMLNNDITTETINTYSNIKGSDLSYEAKFGGDFFANDSYYNSLNYNHDLATTAMALSAAAYGNGNYDGSYIEKALGSGGLGLSDVKTYNYNQNGRNAVAFAFGNMPLNFGIVEERLIAVVVRGTAGNEWYGNFDIGTGVAHQGFMLAKNDVWGNLEPYISSMYSLEYENNEWRLIIPAFKFFITGHSRGAAVANLLAADLILNMAEVKSNFKAKLQEENNFALAGITESDIDRMLDAAFSSKNIFAYTFATPNVTTSADAKGGGFGNVFNLVTAEDFVPYMPLAVDGWGFWKYGTTYVFPSGGVNGHAVNHETPLIANMRRLFNEWTGQTFDSYQDGYYATQNFIQDMETAIPTRGDYYDGFGAGYFDSFCGLITGNPYNPAIFLYPSFMPITEFLVSNEILSNKLTHSHTPETYMAWLKTTNHSDLLSGMELPEQFY